MKKNITTPDSKLNVLIKALEQFHGRKLPENPCNSLATAPRLVYLGLTDLAFSEMEVWGTRGAITEDTLVNPRLRDNFIHSEVRVGTVAGAGVGYHSDFVPLENGLTSLDSIVQQSILEAEERAALDYYAWLGKAQCSNPTFVPNLLPVPAEYFLGQEKKHLISTKRLKKVAQEASKILSINGNDGRVRILVHDEVRRYANTQGTIIKETFFGYHISFQVKAYDAEKRLMEFGQSLFFGSGQPFNGRKVLSFARQLAQRIEERKNCPVIESGTYPILYSAEAMATELHEALVHMLAGDEILAGSTIWGWENFGQRKAHPSLTVYADPGMEGRWGSMNFDYEGVRAQRRILIENGVIKGYLADRNAAYHLSKLTGASILPGDARFDILNNNKSFLPQPRITNLDIAFSDPERSRSKNKLRKKFLRLLRERKGDGLYITDGSSAWSSPDNSQFSSFFHFPYLVKPTGNLIPVKFGPGGGTQHYAHTFMDNLMTLAEPRSYCAHRCGDGEYQALVRAGIKCGPGIVDKVQVVSRREKGRRLR